jgi:hypothetical protein
MSYITRHRPICAVLQQIRDIAATRDDILTISLCDEARTYAESMSRALVTYKEALVSRNIHI